MEHSDCRQRRTATYVRDVAAYPPFHACGSSLELAVASLGLHSLFQYFIAMMLGLEVNQKLSARFVYWSIHARGYR